MQFRLVPVVLFPAIFAQPIPLHPNFSGVGMRLDSHTPVSATAEGLLKGILRRWQSRQLDISNLVNIANSAIGTATGNANIDSTGGANAGLLGEILKRERLPPHQGGLVGGGAAVNPLSGLSDGRLLNLDVGVDVSL